MLEEQKKKTEEEKDKIKFKTFDIKGSGASFTDLVNDMIHDMMENL